MQSLKERLQMVPQTGRLTWIGLREKRRGALLTPNRAEALAGQGLRGDHRSKGNINPANKRQVTLIQAEHLAVIASFMHLPEVAPELLRRNLAVSGINLLALRDRRFYVGEVLLEGTGPCHPCTRMTENLGEGGLAAMRGHGGITARILEGGSLQLGDLVRVS